MTRRQQLIHQLRIALYSLESPYISKEGSAVEFEVADTSFCFEHEQLEEELKDA